VVRERHQATTDLILQEVDARHVKKALAPLIEQGAIFYTDEAATHTPFAQSSGVTHGVNYTKGPRVRGTSHIKNANTYDSRLKMWIQYLHRVATKYIGSYLGWSCMLERYQSGFSPKKSLLEAVGRIPQHLSKA